MLALILELNHCQQLRRTKYVEQNKYCMSCTFDRVLQISLPNSVNVSSQNRLSYLNMKINIFVSSTYMNLSFLNFL